MTTRCANIAALAILLAASTIGPQGPARLDAQARPVQPFHIEEATIDDVHRAIQDGRTTCAAVVKSYIDRARAYNGVCTKIVTADGAPIAAMTGPARAGSAVKFPTATVAVSSVLPQFDQYADPPIDLGHMDSAPSWPTRPADRCKRCYLASALVTSVCSAPRSPWHC